MPASISGTNLIYFPVPKVACTSLKAAILGHNAPGVMTGIETLRETRIPGERPQPVCIAPSGRPVRNVHDYFPTSPFRRWYPLKYKGRWICVVRDPLKRFLSAFGNRVGHHDDLKHTDPAALARAGLSRHPDLDEFVGRLEDYCAASPLLHHHLRPANDFLGRQPQRYARIFSMAEIDRIAPYCAESGAEVVLPRLQTGGTKLGDADLSPAARKKLMAYYAEDYLIWGRHIDG